MSDNSELKIGVDIGGSKINIVLWDGKRIVARRQAQEVSLKRLNEELSHFKVSKIGIAIPGILDFKTGNILKCPNLSSFNGLNLKEILKKDIYVDNDANCFLRAEAKLGAGRGYNDILAVTMGTGIGGAIKIAELNKDLVYKGARGSAGEFGHIIIDGGKTWEELYQATKEEPKQQEKVNAIGLANLINIFDPEIIILGGGGAKLPKRELIERYIISPLAKKAKIVGSKLGLDACAIGAALLCE